MDSPIPATMHAAYLTGHGGLDKLQYRDDVPVPKPKADEVLIRVGACGMNNTDINTRTAWYSKNVSDGTTAEGGTSGFATITAGAATWGGGSVSFPRVQGADIVGRIVAVGEDVAQDRIGERVLVEAWVRDPKEPENRNLAGYVGSERDGGYAEYVAIPVVNVYRIESTLTDPELATFPCSYSTAEYMMTRARLGEGETVLITGASGGVGSALIQLAKRRGAEVIAVAGATKVDEIRELGADSVIARDTSDLEAAVRAVAASGEVDVVADIVGGKRFPILIELLNRGGRYVAAGAIAGPIVELDLRTLYLRDLELWGATVMPQGIFQNLVGYIERGEVRPLLAKTFPLADIRQAQTEFLKKRHVGNFVLIPG
jgi:NADPH:quinone reductase-like Zn-dependent oxidoreductase